VSDASMLMGLLKEEADRRAAWRKTMKQYAAHRLEIIVVAVFELAQAASVGLEMGFSADEIVEQFRAVSASLLVTGADASEAATVGKMEALYEEAGYASRRGKS
jgi:hypothetical protein